jgi:hypothetical protein
MDEMVQKKVKWGAAGGGLSENSKAGSEKFVFLQ